MASKDNFKISNSPSFDRDDNASTHQIPNDSVQ